MSLNNTTAKYGTVSKTLHWLMALLILSVIPLGIIANGLAHDIRDPAISTTDREVARAALLFSLHKTIGVTIFLTALCRIVWTLSQPKPGLLNADNKPEALAAETVHWLLYGSLLLVPLTGWIHHSATTGFAPIWWPLGQSLPFVPKSESVAATFGTLHILFVRVLLVALFLHIAGALKHHFVDRDMTLLRMWPGERETPTPPEQRHTALPVVCALAVWGGALGLGATLGAFGHDHSHSMASETELQQVQSEWQVTEGALEITVNQMGSPVEGSFADWTAAIDFDETVTSGHAGHVTVTISIGSLTLGSVTAQAMGPDFFDAETHPVATFDADIERTDDGYVASGPLTIRGKSTPISMPFELTVEDQTAEMTGSLILNRLDYDVGASMPDESSLGFSVDVSVRLTAAKAIN